MKGCLFSEGLDGGIQGPTSEGAEAATKKDEKGIHDVRQSSRARTFVESLMPGELSAPEAISMAVGWTASIASTEFLVVRPPARMTGSPGWEAMKSFASVQSKVLPVPP